MSRRYEIEEDMTGAVTIREGDRLAVGVSRPVFDVRPGTGVCAGTWTLDLADGDNGWGFDDAASASHAAMVTALVKAQEARYGAEAKGGAV